MVSLSKTKWIITVGLYIVIRKKRIGHSVEHDNSFSRMDDVVFM